MMRELASAAKMKQPGVAYYGLHTNTQPLVKLHLELQPNSPDAAEVNGRLTVSVRPFGGTTLSRPVLWHASSMLGCLVAHCRGFS
jgi:hypothetical protein